MARTTGFVWVTRIFFILFFSIIFASSAFAFVNEKKSADPQLESAGYTVEDGVVVPMNHRKPAFLSRQQSYVQREKNYKEDELLVKFKSKAWSAATTGNVHKKNGSSKIKEFSSLRVHHVKLKEGLSVREAIEAYKRDPDVEYAEPNFRIKALATPNDSLFNQLWNMQKINAPAAWDITTGNNNVVVAVIDTGVDYSHADLSENIWTNPGEIFNGIDDDQNGYIDDVYGIDTVNLDSNPFDDNGHGTHVSGIIGAVGNNGQGVAGVNWNVKIMPCKFLDSGGYGYTDGAVQCLNYIKMMKDRGVTIIATNNSWGEGGYSQVLYNAIHAQQNILFIAAAGNSGANNDVYSYLPANYYLPNIISVAATDNNDTVASFSNYGRRNVSVSAPGVQILSTLPAQNEWSIAGGYGLLSGTSMAAPHVTGLAVLIKAQNSGRDWIAIKNLILSGGNDNPDTKEKTITGKQVNAYGSLTCVDSGVFSALRYPDSITAGTPATLSALSINCASPSGPVSVTSISGEIINLYDNGVAPDLAAGDGIFTGTWTPSREAEILTFSSPEGTEVISITTLTIVPYILEGNTRSSYSHFLTAFGGRPPYTWTVIGNLPAGLQLSNSTGEISGKPEAAGIFYFTVAASDALNMTVTKAVSLQIFNDHFAGLWGKTIPSKESHFGNGIVVDSSGNSYAAGEFLTPDPNTGDTRLGYFIVKYDASGNMHWTKTRAEDGKYISANGIALDMNGNLYVPGHIWTGVSANYNLSMIKYDPSGNILWEKTYTYGSYAAGYSVALDASGNIYVAGTTSNGSNEKFMMSKLSRSGDMLWVKTYDLGTRLFGDGGIAVDESGVYMAGRSFQIDAQGNWELDFVTVKWDLSGNQLWADRYDVGQYDQVSGVAMDPSGVYVAGTIQSINSPCAVRKYDASGAELWTKSLNLTCSDIVADGNGNIYVSDPGKIAKYDLSGTLIWETSYLYIQGNGYSSIALEETGNIYATGFRYDNDVGVYYFLAGKYQADLLSINDWTLPAGSIAIPYSKALTASGGPEPYVWSIISGNLPVGLSIDSSTGVISGTPTESGMFNFTVQVTDANLLPARKPLSLSVQEVTAVPAGIGVFRNGAWYLDINGNGSWDGVPIDTFHWFGFSGSIPVTGDWNDDGITEIGVYDPSTAQWYLDDNGSGAWDGMLIDGLHSFGGGVLNALPVTGDWNGSGTTKIGVYADGVWYLDLNGNRSWDGTPTDGQYHFGGGIVNALPVTGDWNGSETTKIGIYADGVWYLDLNGNGAWDSTPTDGQIYFGGGVVNAVPVIGDWGGTGAAKIGVSVNGTWYLDTNGNGGWDGAPVDGLHYLGVGMSGARPVTGKW